MLCCADHVTDTVSQVLAGNDKVKTDAGREGLLPLIVTSMDRHVSR